MAATSTATTTRATRRGRTEDDHGIDQEIEDVDLIVDGVAAGHGDQPLNETTTRDTRAREYTHREARGQRRKGRGERRYRGAEDKATERHAHLVFGLLSQAIDRWRARPLSLLLSFDSIARSGADTASSTSATATERESVVWWSRHRLARRLEVSETLP